MIIDIHMHARSGHGDVADLVATMDRTGVDMGVLLPIDIEDPELGESSTEWIVEQARKFPDRLIPFANINPLQPDATGVLVRYIQEYGCKGLKLHPPLHDFRLDDPAVLPVLRIAGDLGIPVLTHTGPIFVRNSALRYGYALPIDDLARACPETTIILAHGDPLGDSAVLAGKHPNVYIDISIVIPRLTEVMPGILRNTLEWISEGTQHGPDKVLFGSDTNPLRPDRLEKTRAAVAVAGLDENTTRKILGGNAARILRLDSDPKEA